MLTLAQPPCLAYCCVVSGSRQVVIFLAGGLTGLEVDSSANQIKSEEAVWQGGLTSAHRLPLHSPCLISALMSQHRSCITVCLFIWVTTMSIKELIIRFPIWFRNIQILGIVFEKAIILSSIYFHFPVLHITRLPSHPISLFCSSFCLTLNVIFIAYFRSHPFSVWITSHNHILYTFIYHISDTE